MHYDKLNARGAAIADRFAREQGLDGVVTTELTPPGRRAAFFRLRAPAVGAAVSTTVAKLIAAGFEPDVGYAGTSMASVSGGFIGKAFSDKATALDKQRATGEPT